MKRALHVLSWVVFVAVLGIAGLMLIPSILGYDR
jgi:hypothetical protein